MLPGSETAWAEPPAASYWNYKLPAGESKRPVAERLIFQRLPLKGECNQAGGADYAVQKTGHRLVDRVFVRRPLAG
jgi:hypothetical protein